ncbi:MAG: hypothetical protein J7518_17915 [Nocardioidaceae bacterium]|nr:hypothetical protein [Nocardioidaceae bacterium]
MTPYNKWSRHYFADLAERVGTTTIYGLIAVLTGDATGAVSNDPKVWWTVVGLPTVLSVLKGVLSNLADDETGPSLLPSETAED